MFWNIDIFLSLYSANKDHPRILTYNIRRRRNFILVLGPRTANLFRYKYGNTWLLNRIPSTLSDYTQTIYYTPKRLKMKNVFIDQSITGGYIFYNKCREFDETLWL